MLGCYASRGFLPCKDPATELQQLGEGQHLLDRVGHALPSLLLEADARQFLERLTVPEWPYANIPPDLLPQARLYYLRLGFIVSGYVNQVGQPPVHRVPVNLARPLCQIAHLMQRPPVLSYDGYALYNWQRYDHSQPVALGNIDTVQNFVHLYDEHWFILVHVEIEAMAAEILDAILGLQGDITPVNVDVALVQISAAMQRIIGVLQRIPEKMSDALYFSRFRPYIGQFVDVLYEGVTQKTISFRGETGAQSSVMPLLTAFMKIPHQANKLTQHLQDMRHYMPAEHRALLQQVAQMPEIRLLSRAEYFDGVLELMAQFREVHYHWAVKYIARRGNDKRGTGGTPYMRWLKFLIDETRQYKLQPPQIAV